MASLYRGNDRRMSRAVSGAFIILFIFVPCLLEASTFDGRLFYTPEERDRIDGLTYPLIKEVGEVESPIRNTVSNSPLLSFDGVMGADINPSLWINKALWNKRKALKGVEAIQWSMSQRRLLVSHESGKRFTLSVGQCLMRHLIVRSCASISIK